MFAGGGACGELVCGVGGEVGVRGKESVCARVPLRFFGNATVFQVSWRSLYLFCMEMFAPSAGF